MFAGIEALTTASLSLALDAATLRQQAIASNIANADVAGYQALEVAFESQLTQARESLQRQGSVDAFSLADVQLKMTPMASTSNVPASIKLDAEVAKLAQNTLHYQALIKGLNRHFSLLSSAISEGKK
jgi:flagellar basal-body rod protein FlgB